MKKIIPILIILFLVGGTVIVVGGFTGKLPFATKALGLNKPKDLGVDYSLVDVDKIHERIGTVHLYDKNRAGDVGVAMEGQKSVKYSMTQEEITALSNNSPYKYNPFSNAQVRINDDGSVEGSAILKIKTVFDFANAMGYSSDQVREQMEKYNIPFNDMPVYIKAAGFVKDNNIEATVSRAEVARIPLPSFIVEQAAPQLIAIGEGLMNSFPGFSVKSMTFSNGKMNFEGTIPEKQYFE